MYEIQNLSKWLASVVYANVQDIFSPVSWNTFHSETANLLLRIIIESFKLHYFFLIRLILAMNILLCKHKSVQMPQAVKQLPKTFHAQFPVSVNISL